MREGVHNGVNPMLLLLDPLTITEVLTANTYLTTACLASRKWYCHRCEKHAAYYSFKMLPTVRITSCGYQS